MTKLQKLTTAVAITASLVVATPVVAQSSNGYVANFGGAELVDANFKFKKKFGVGKFGKFNRFGRSSGFGKAKKFNNGFGGFNNGFGGGFNSGFGGSVFLGNRGFGGAQGFFTF